MTQKDLARSYLEKAMVRLEVLQFLYEKRAYKKLFPEFTDSEVKRLREISKWLRKERELAFYGDLDFILTEEYTEEEAKKPQKGLNLCLSLPKE